MRKVPQSYFIVSLFHGKINRIEEGNLKFGTNFCLSLPAISLCAAYPANFTTYLIIVMKKLFNLKTAFCALFLIAALLFPVAGCAKKQPDLFSYVSELRDNVLIAELPCADGISGNSGGNNAGENRGKTGESKALLTVYSYLREQPYLDDGAAGTTERIAAFYFSEKDGSSTFLISFTAQGGKNAESGGEMSYNDAKKQYYYMCSLDLSETAELPVTVKNAKTGKEYAFTAKTVKTANTISPRAALSAFESAESETLAPMKSDGDFAGEIRIRLIESEGKTYYYVGVISADKATVSYLLDGETAKILAKRESK